MLKKIVLVAILIVLVVFASKDILAKAALNYYLSKNPDLEHSIESLDLYWGSLDIQGIKLKYKDFTINISNSKILFKLPEVFRTKTLNFVINQARLTTRDKDFSLSGAFDGKFMLVLAAGELKELSGRLLNSKGGVINIKKDNPMALGPYLDSASQEAITAAFQNYNYSKGLITMAREGNRLLVGLEFDSEELGKRSISLNLHHIFADLI